MIKLIRNTPSSNIPQVNVSLLLAVLQFTIMIFTFNPCITAQIKLTIISGPNDWTEIIDTLQNAKIEGRSVCISLLPPSKTPPICPTCKYSEPFRLDYHSWAKAIAELSLRYSNLTGYTIGDLQENLNLGYIRQTYIDSMEISGNSINPKLQFIKTRPNIYYVDKYAIGNGNGSSWTNAANSISALNWSSIHGGDTVYVSGGTDSVTYGRTQLSGKGDNTGIIVLTKGWEAGHNGKVIFLAQDTSHDYTFQFTNNCTNIKITGLTLKWTGMVTGNTEEVIVIEASSYIYIDNCDIHSNGKAYGILADHSDFISITNNTIEIADNNYPQDQDGINFYYGKGGYTITGNRIITRGTNFTPHKDIIQMTYVGDDNKYLTTIANNFMSAINDTGTIHSQGIYIDVVGSNRFLIYNNIVTVSSGGSVLTVTQTSPYHTTAQIYNNTLIAKSHYPFFASNLDTLIFENNICIIDAPKSGISVMGLGGGGLGLYGLGYKVFDYNQYFQRGQAIRIDTGAYYHTIWAQWKALGYDAHSDTGIVNFANIWGTDASYYKLATGSTDIDGGTDLSAYFTIDIVGTTRPLSTKWDRGALQTAVTSN
jgi:hypothetical protein